MKFGNYKAKRNDKGHLVVERVPIFVECKRGDTHFSDEWIAAAVRKAKQAELEGYLPPLHIRHHENGTTVEPAGYFRIRGAAPVTFKGKTRTAIFADLVITRDWVAEDVIAARLPYRSVEIFDVDDPAINSLALLDHEPPYLELPMLMVDEPEGDRQENAVASGAIPTSGTLVRVADATFANPWLAEGRSYDGPVVACFRRGHSAHLFIEDTEDMSIKKNETAGNKQATTKAKPGKTGSLFADDKEDDGEKMADDEVDDGEKMEDGGLDVAAVCKAIADGSITVADMEAIKAAIVAQMSDVAEDEEEPEAAPVTATPGEAMKNEPKQVAKFAAMQAKIDAQEAKLAQMEHATARKEAVEEAMLRLEGRPLGSNPEAKFAKRFDELGAKGFGIYIDDLAALAGKLPEGSSGKAATFANQKKAAPDVALAYTEQGVEAVDRATMFAAEHDALAGKGLRHGKAEYVRSNMLREGFKAPKLTA